MKPIFIYLLLVFICPQTIVFAVNRHGLSSLNEINATHVKNSVNVSRNVAETTPAPNLGSIASFALFTTTGAVGNTGISNVTGNIGTNVGAVTGFGLSVVTGSTYINNSVTAQCVTDLSSLYNQLTATTTTAAHGAVFGNGETLDAGVYSLGAAGSAAGVLTLDAQGNTNAIFIFKIGGAFNTGAASSVVLINGASASNVFWVVDGAIAMAAGTSMKGTLISNNGAVSMGTGGILEGRMLSTTGAIATYNDTIYLPGSNGFNWIGFVSTNWNTPANWLNNVVPTSTDQALIGVNETFNYFPNIPAAYGVVSVGSIQFGSLGGQAPGVVVNTGSSLSVSGAITYQSDAGSALGYTCKLSGLGVINAGSVSINANTDLLFQPYTQTFASSVANLNITANITLTSTQVSIDIFNAAFNLTGGTALLSGIVQTSNSAGSTSTFSVIPAATATLQLANSAALSGLSATGTNVIGFKNAGATIEYSGSAQTVYNDAVITGLSTGVGYQNIKFSGAGLKTLSPGNLNIAGDFTNALANDAGNNVSLLTNMVNFNGAVQALAGGVGTGTVFNNVAFSGAGTKTMASGSFHVASSGVLTISGNNANTILNAAGLLTLNSDASGSAAVATILAGPAISGNVNVQRYFKAQASGTTADNTRNYRLLSSPVNNGSGNYGLSYLNTNSGGVTGVFVSGPTGTAGGFTVTNATPTIYIYNESLTSSNASFSGGNFKGVTNIAGNVLTYYNSSGTTTSNTSVPVGNGFMLYYMGNNVNNITSTTALNKQYRYGGSYIAPDASVTTASGILNQGAIPLSLWWNGSNTLSNAKTGFNLVGNPYASAIDWDQYSASSNTAGIYAPLVSSTIYVFNYANKNYGAYPAGTSGGMGTNNASRYIASGQGFFIRATAASGALLTFNETAKTAVQPGTNGSSFVLLSVLNPPAGNQLMRVKLAKDSVNTDDIMLTFDPDAKNEYEPYIDVDRLSGMGNVATLASYSYSSDILLAINRLKSIDTNTRVKLYVNIKASAGVDTLSASGFDTLDPRFDVYLIDHYKNDSLMFSKYPQYLFNMSNADTASFGANRFELAFHKKSALNYKLISFFATIVKTGVLLTWTTADEDNFTGFTLTREDGSKQFVAINQLQSNGSGSYTYVDTSPLSGINYYRLAQNDAFNTLSYSGIIAVNEPVINGSSGSLTLYPNPVTTQFTININYNVPQKVTLRVINSVGEILIERICDGNNIHQDASSLQPGNYLAEIIDTNTMEVIGAAKFIKN